MAGPDGYLGGMRRTLAGLVLALAACNGDSDTAPTTTTIAIQADTCLVRVHGRSESGAPAAMRDGYAELSPGGNGASGEGRQWVYFPEAKYTEARDIVTAAVDEAGCARVVLNGFSNGAAFVASMYCNGETFAGRLTGVVVDDPVPDEGSLDCAPADGVNAALYWTGALTQAEPGTDCDGIGWICEGGRVVGIDAYAASLGVAIQPSSNATHTWYRDAPELVAWLAPA